jgi:hypothetical protein
LLQKAQPQLPQFVQQKFPSPLCGEGLGVGIMSLTQNLPFAIVAIGDISATKFAGK